MNDMHKGYFAIALYAPEKEVNIGTVIRSTKAFGGSFVAIIGGKYKEQGSDTYNAYGQLPVWGFESWESFLRTKPKNLMPLAVEITDNAIQLETSIHPKQCVYVFGPEGGSLPHSITDRISTVKINTIGCLNLATCATIVMYDRSIKMLQEAKK